MNIFLTGASSGIGRDTALHLARSGHHVIAAARRIEAIEELVRELAASVHHSSDAKRPRGSITPLFLDLDDPDSIAAAAGEVLRTTNNELDALVNNAGFATAGALAELTDRDLRKQFETNVFGLMALTRAVLPAMLARGRGRVVNVSSVSGRIPAPVLGAYHASKYALEALSDALRMELAAFGIQVVIVEPGTTKSEFAQRAMSEGMSAKTDTSRYAPIYARARELESKFDRFASSTAPSVKAIARALEARRPRARYIAPRRFALLIGAVRLLPTCWSDALMRRAFGLTKETLQLVNRGGPKLGAT